MAEGRIRAVALAIFIRPRDGAVLAVRFPDPDHVFYRPPGGGIEFGEHAREAPAVRRWRNSATPVRADRLLGVTENLFVYDGRQRHEIVFNWLLRFEDASLYDATSFRSRRWTGSTIQPTGCMMPTWRPKAYGSSRVSCFRCWRPWHEQR